MSQGTRITLVRVIAAVVISAVFVVAVEHFQGWTTLLYPWRFVNDARGLAIAACLLGLTYAIRAFRLFRYFHLRTGFTTCVRLQLQHTALVNVLPFRTGELAFPMLMNRYLDTSISRAITGLFWLRVLDLHVLLTIAVFLIALNAFDPWLAGLLTLLWAVSLFAAYLCLPGILRWMPEGRSKWITGVRGVAQSPPSSLTDFYECWVLTVLNWTVKLLVFGWIIELFSSQSYVNSLAGAIGGELSGILPIQGLAAFGTYEAGVLLAMTALGVSANNAMAGAFNLHLFILGTSLLGAYPTILFRADRAQRS